MLHRTRALLILATSIAAVSAATDAPAQSGRREAGPYPAHAPVRLSVAPDQQGFSITSRKPGKTPAATGRRVSVGARLKLDRALFANSEGSKEAIDAPRR